MNSISHKKVFLTKMLHILTKIQRLQMIQILHLILKMMVNEIFPMLYAFLHKPKKPSHMKIQ